MSTSRKVRAAEGQTLRLLRLLAFARKRIHVRPPGLEDHRVTKWAREVSTQLPDFPHWDGQSPENRRAVERGEDLEPAGW